MLDWRTGVEPHPWSEGFRWNYPSGCFPGSPACAKVVSRPPHGTWTNRAKWPSR
jgi:hypothetical protein